MAGQSTDIDTSDWTVIYPTYLDKNATTTRGRRVSLSLAVPKPTVEEIKLVCERLNVKHVVEPGKCYPRDWLVPGRVRVLLKDPDSGEKTRSKKQLLNEIASLISQLKTRQQPKETPSTSATKKKAGKKKR
ncbi:signal recognition particle 19 kD protein, putative [Theileria equi strain WA]|uniref:Signal recognition particle 19 kD protein, putative n=1 Tax=Theileria equi strain WA TaxID=1537102 RepID=L0B011_THEEQ|nr:signal recognition particle 19 kD protein, putative [Theileria equi strain WA]AFZ80459.1 signal recognition particle 19 kD protein, putative [Theileria equi strain WA]|eukprot:XP_004830125.1 signal recognition particle 19 kD protein, putative [Theileria equi strain WA]